jgi:Sulfate permease family
VFLDTFVSAFLRFFKPNSQVKQNLPSDILAGVTVGVLAVPQAMSYALVAGINPKFGLYTSAFPMVICKCAVCGGETAALRMRDNPADAPLHVSGTDNMCVTLPRSNVWIFGASHFGRHCYRFVAGEKV